MATLQIKKDTFKQKIQQEFFDRYARAKKVDLPLLIEERYGIQFSFGGSGKNGDAQGYGLRVGRKYDQQIEEEIWLANGSAVGDAVKAVMELDKQHLNIDTSKSEAIGIIETFNKSKNVSNTQRNTVTKFNNSATSPQKIKLPEKADHSAEEQLYEYATKERGVRWSTINEAQSDGFLAKSQKGFTFLGGLGHGNIKQAETRLMKPFINEDGKEIRFLCAEGSDRSYPPILPGSPTSTEVHLVEGGFDALGLREYLKRRDRNDTIVMTGGKDNTNWLKHKHIKELMVGKTVNIWRDNEKSPEVQAQADEAFAKLLESLRNAGVQKIKDNRVPEGVKDIAHLNFLEKEQIRLNEKQHKTSISVKSR